MTSKILKEVFERVQAWPEQRPEDAAQVLLEMERQDARTVHVNGPWCITFEFDSGDALRVDFEQYH